MSMREILLELNRRGLIQGPDESEEAFFKRCGEAQASGSVPSSLTKELFDITIDWVSVAYANKHLRFWEGGCAWIEGNAVSIQLKKHFQQHDVYLGLYSKEELLAHEYVHAARIAFEEPIFEEMLAFQTSKSFLRKTLGPFFRKHNEINFLLLSLLLLFFTAFFTPFSWLAAIGGVGIFGFGFFRLFRTMRFFSNTFKRLAHLVGEKQALPVMVRLSDREIIRFSSMDKSQILAYAKKMSKTQLRWKQIVYAYFSPSQDSFSYEEVQSFLQDIA